MIYLFFLFLKNRFLLSFCKVKYLCLTTLNIFCFENYYCIFCNLLENKSLLFHFNSLFFLIYMNLCDKNCNIKE
jgi:hypothetical protein